MANEPIVIIKTTSGEEIIAKVLVNTADEFKVAKPRMITMMAGPDGRPQPAIMPWIISAPDADVPINNSVMAIIPAPKDVERMYLQNTTSIDLSGKL
jgi:hypothetical protein